MKECVVHIKNSEITNKKSVRNYFNDFKDGAYLLTSKRINKRSTNQNRYYWGCVVQMIKDRMVELGNEVDSDLVHDFLKDKFNRKELFDKDGVIIGSVGESTTKLTTLEFEEYLEKVKRFASEVLDIYIPDPNKQNVLFNDELKLQS